jgi:hypothetical protein
MRNRLTLLALMLTATLTATPSVAQSSEPLFDEPSYGAEQFDEPPVRRRSRSAQSYQEAQAEEPNLTPSDAAGIAQDAVPGSRVLKVKLLPSGDYAVTVKVKGSVVRVVVSGVDGSIL